MSLCATEVEVLRKILLEVEEETVYINTQDQHADGLTRW